MNFGLIILAVLFAVWLYGAIWFTQVAHVFHKFDRKLKAAMQKDGRTYKEGGFFDGLISFILVYTVTAFLCGLFAWRSDEFRMIVYSSALRGLEKSQPEVIRSEMVELMAAFAIFETT